MRFPPASYKSSHPTLRRGPTACPPRLRTVARDAVRSIRSPAADLRSAVRWWFGVPPSAVDPDTWSLVTLRADLLWPDGTVDDLHAQTLQPPEWIARHAVRPGHPCPVPLDLAEMGIGADIRPTVVAIEPCPQIEHAPGRVVLTTVNHLNRARVDVHVRPADDSRLAGGSLAAVEVIETTAPHKFLRLPRSMAAGQGSGDEPPAASLASVALPTKLPTKPPADIDDMDAHPAWWAAAADLRPGDRLHTPDGWAEVDKVVPRPGTDRVYNLTVEHEHLFRVGRDGLLVHNSCPPRQQTGRAPHVDSGELTESEFLDRALDYLGPGYRSDPNGRYISADGTRVIRYGRHETASLGHHHAHFEYFDPDFGRVVENGVVRILPD